MTKYSRELRMQQHWVAPQSVNSASNNVSVAPARLPMLSLSLPLPRAPDCSVGARSLSLSLPLSPYRALLTALSSLAAFGALLTEYRHNTVLTCCVRSARN